MDELDELTRRERALRAERLRPERVVGLPDLLTELIGAIHQAFLTEPDEPTTSGNVSKSASDLREPAARECQTRLTESTQGAA